MVCARTHHPVVRVGRGLRLRALFDGGGCSEAVSRNIMCVCLHDLGVWRRPQHHAACGSLNTLKCDAVP